MVVYNIRKEIFSQSLTASGVANRWNKDDEFIIYAAGSVALATLALIAHRGAINVGNQYQLIAVQLVLAKSDIKEIRSEDLPSGWKLATCYPQLQELGSSWYQSNQSLILKVPSTLVPSENHFLINTNHPDFNQKVSIHFIEPFNWDNRLV